MFERYRSPGPAIEEEALAENEEALNRAAQSPAKKVTRIGANASAGLIILNNRSLPIPNPVQPPVSQSSLGSASINGFTESSSPRPPSANSAKQIPAFPQTVSHFFLQSISNSF